MTEFVTKKSKAQITTYSVWARAIVRVRNGNLRNRCSNKTVGIWWARPTLSRWSRWVCTTTWRRGRSGKRRLPLRNKKQNQNVTTYCVHRWRKTFDRCVTQQSRYRTRVNGDGGTHGEQWNRRPYRDTGRCWLLAAGDVGERRRGTNDRLIELVGVSRRVSCAVRRSAEAAGPRVSAPRRRRRQTTISR